MWSARCGGVDARAARLGPARAASPQRQQSSSRLRGERGVYTLGGPPGQGDPNCKPSTDIQANDQQPKRQAQHEAEREEKTTTEAAAKPGNAGAEAAPQETRLRGRTKSRKQTARSNKHNAATLRTPGQGTKQGERQQTARTPQALSSVAVTSGHPIRGPRTTQSGPARKPSTHRAHHPPRPAAELETARARRTDTPATPPPRSPPAAAEPSQNATERRPTSHYS